jgi:hypothetical protein
MHGEWPFKISQTADVSTKFLTGEALTVQVPSSCLVPEYQKRSGAMVITSSSLWPCETHTQMAHDGDEQLLSFTLSIAKDQFKFKDIVIENNSGSL